MGRKIVYKSSRTVSREGLRILTEEEMKVKGCMHCSERKRGTVESEYSRYKNNKVDCCKHSACPYYGVVAR